MRKKILGLDGVYDTLDAMKSRIHLSIPTGTSDKCTDATESYDLRLQIDVRAHDSS